jgi:hypothetical protein
MGGILVAGAGYWLAVRRPWQPGEPEPVPALANPEPDPVLAEPDPLGDVRVR